MSLDPADTIDALVSRELPAARRGCQTAYGRIVDASQNTVTAVALAITRDVAASEDIAQEAFLSAWQNLGSLHNPASFLPWLRQITRNLARDHLRRQAHRPLDGANAELAIELAADPGPTPAERLLDDERELVAMDLIAELPEESREVLLLFYREGQSSKQVADLLGLSDAAVRKRLSRARQSVRDDLLSRFGEFARSSAPSAAFVIGVTAALGVVKPAAASGLANVGVVGFASIGKTVVGKAFLGSALAVAFGLLAAWICRGLLRRYARTPQEWQSIVRWYDIYLVGSAVGLALGAAAYMLFGMHVASMVVIASYAVFSWPLLGPFRRTMAPLLARDAAEHPQGAETRALVHRLTFGVSGALIGFLALVTAMLMLNFHAA